MTEPGNNRLVLLLIAGIPLTMILAASWLWYFVAEGELDLVGALGTANRGTLLAPPRQIDEAALFSAELPTKYADLEPKWAFVVPWSGPSCDAVCENTLYTTRQIHIAIGKDFNRIRRLYVGDTQPGEIRLASAKKSSERPLPQDFAQYLETEHRGMKPLVVARADFPSLFEEWQTDPSTWYLVDPRGWIMMSYNKDIPYKDVISDLKFLLKNSSD
jgi:hypothetical protein